MADSDSEQHFYGKNQVRPQSKREERAQQANDNMIQDDDDGFNQDDDAHLFNRPQIQEQEKQSNNEERDVRKLKKLKKIKKRRRGSDGDSFNDRQSESDSDEEQEKRFFRRKGQKSNKKGQTVKRRQPAKPKEQSQRQLRMRIIREQSRREAETLLDQMNKRYEQDRQSKENDGPALAKLKYLKDMSSALENIFVQEYFLQSDGLQIIEKWLRRYSNGQQPSYVVRKKVLEVILMMNVKSNHILKCQELPSLIEKLKKCNQQARSGLIKENLRENKLQMADCLQLRRRERLIVLHLDQFIMLQSVGIAIVSNDKEKSKKFLELLTKYLPSESAEASTRVHIQTKYYKANPTILALDWEQLQSLKDNTKDIECLLIISRSNNEGNLQDEAFLMDEIDSTIERFSPTSYALIVDTPDSQQQVNVQKIFEKVETFVQVIYENIDELVKKQEMPPIPKSLLEDAGGIVRVVMLLQATTWKEMQFREQSKKQEKKEQKKEESVKKVQSPQDCIKIEKQMDEFASIMMEMCSIKNSVLSDQERKLRAEQVIMRLMKGMEDDQQLW